MTFLLLHCHYDPDNYHGHRVHTLEAKDLEAAKVEAKLYMDKHWVKLLWEFRIVELKYDSGCRLWDTRTPTKVYQQTEIDYTIKNYWEKKDA